MPGGGVLHDKLGVGTIERQVVDIHGEWLGVGCATDGHPVDLQRSDKGLEGSGRERRSARGYA